MNKTRKLIYGGILTTQALLVTGRYGYLIGEKHGEQTANQKNQAAPLLTREATGRLEKAASGNFTLISDEGERILLIPYNSESTRHLSSVSNSKVRAILSSRGPGNVYDVFPHQVKSLDQTDKSF